MTKKHPLRPTEAELAILNVLWERGPSTVRSVHDTLEHSDVGYTTVLKILQIMHGKELVRRDVSERAHVYRAAHTKPTTQRQLTHDLVQRAFDGSTSQLVLHALGKQSRATPEELRELRALLERLEEEQSA